MKKGEMELLRPGDIIEVDGDTYKGIGVVTLSSGRKDPNLKGEISYAFRSGESFPQVVVFAYDGQLIHYNGDDSMKLEKIGVVVENSDMWIEGKRAMNNKGVYPVYQSKKVCTTFR